MGPSRDLFLVRAEYNDDSLIVPGPNRNVQRGTIVTTPLNGNYNNANGVRPVGTTPQEFSDEDDPRVVGSFFETTS